MVSERNRILELVEYFQSLGIEVNMKTKARGNKGFFKTNGKGYRIDVAKSLEEDSALSVLIHEFAHYFHYLNDKTLRDLTFIIDDNDILLEELLALTVEDIPKDFALSLFSQKEILNQEIKTFSSKIKKLYPDFKLSQPCKPIEKDIKTQGLSCLLKYDRVKMLKGFSYKLYSVDDTDFLKTKITESHIDYLKLKSKQRLLRRINSKISKLNKYYNSETELFARSIEKYFLEHSSFSKIAPNLKEVYDTTIKTERFPILNKINKIVGLL